MENEFKLLLEKHCLDKSAAVVQLENYAHIPVAALYLDKVDYENIVVSETKTKEKYYVYINGIAIFFSYFRFIEKLN